MAKEIGNSTELSRRQFVAQSAIYGGTFLAMINLPRPLAVAASHESDSPVTFNPDQWRTVEAITGRIIPADHEPGAIEANCVNFIDKALAHEDASQKPQYNSGLQGVNAASQAQYGKAFADLDESDQDTLLAAMESGSVEGWPEAAGAADAFFETIRAHTIIGFLADPKYGGNQDYAGWKVIGYPGPSHHSGGYTPEQQVGDAPIHPIWEHGEH